jgi:tetratricopeptide (TPR) repeat protein
MAGRAESKVQEGLKYTQEAEKCLKKGWFKSADHEGAAQAYTKAGNAFRNAKSFEQAKKAFMFASEQQDKCKSLYQAGKALELAGQMAKELKQMDEAIGLTEKAGYKFRENGTPDTASQVFQKAAKLAEDVNAEKAIKLYKVAFEMFEVRQ